MVDNYIAAFPRFPLGAQVVPATASPTCHPGKVVRVHDDGKLDICWRGTPQSTARNIDPARLRNYR